MKTQKDHFQSLLKISSSIEHEYLDSNKAWETSPFKWIKSKSSRSRGSIGQALVEKLCLAEGFPVAPSNHSDFSRIISGLHVGIKFSTLWDKNKFYRFQQLRDQNYDVVFCLGLSPLSASAWVIPKEKITEGKNILPGLGGQHTGKEGKETAWLTVYPLQPHGWLKPYGGEIGEALQILKEFAEAKK